MPVINPRLPSPEEIADSLIESLKKRGEKVNKDRVRKLIKKLFDKDDACN